MAPGHLGLPADVLDRELSTLDLLLLRLRNMALAEGNDRAFEELHRLIKAYQPQATIGGAGYLVVPAALTPEEFVAKIEKANAEAEAQHVARERFRITS